MARTVTAHLFSSVNGVSESPHLFQFDSFGEAEGELMDRSLAGVTDVHGPAALAGMVAVLARQQRRWIR